MSEVTVLDGPVGTLLEVQGVPTPAPLWSGAAVRDAPGEIASIHRAYAAAGATVHTAATFRTTPARAGAAARALTHRAVRLARQAVPAHHRVLGSLAPAADCWHPEDTPDDAARAHRAMAELLVEAGVDGLLVETFADADEAVIATAAAARTGRPVWTALTSGYDNQLLTPAALQDAARRVRDAGAALVLVNCLPAARALPWVDALAALDHPFGVYANAGRVDEGLRHGTDGAADRYATLARDWVARGAVVVGGCCGTGPDHVQALSVTFASMA